MKQRWLGRLIRWTSLTLFTSLILFTSLSSSLAHSSGAPTTPVLVELFTSEGCSSCPPADQLLIDLMASQPVPDARIVALSEHVDYWNQLGWTDPFSASQFSGRQTEYGARIGEDVYTPQIVVDGHVAFVGSDRSAALTAIRTAANRSKAVIQLSWKPGERALAITVPPAANQAESKVFLAVTEDGLSSSVRRGENEGLLLKHGAVTRRLSELGATDGRGMFSRTVPVALDPSWKPAALHVVVFVQSRSGVSALETIAVK